MQSSDASSAGRLGEQLNMTLAADSSTTGTNFTNMETNFILSTVMKSTLPYSRSTSQISLITHYLKEECLRFHVSNDNKNSNLPSKALVTSQHFFHALNSTIQVQQLRSPETHLVLLQGQDLIACCPAANHLPTAIERG